MSPLNGDFSKDFGGLILSFPGIGQNIMFKILERESTAEGCQASNAVRHEGAQFGTNSVPTL